METKPTETKTNTQENLKHITVHQREFYGLQLLDKQYWMQSNQLYIGKKNKEGSLTFFKQTFKNTFLVPPGLKPGDILKTGIAKKKETQKTFCVEGMTINKLVLKEITP